MSWLSQLTGVNISPKGVSVSRPDPIGTVKSIAQNPLPLLGLAIPGVGSALGGILGSIPGASAVGGALSSIPGVSSVEGLLGMGGGAGTEAAGGAAMGLPSSAGGLGGMISKLGGSGGWDLNKILQAASGAEGAYNTIQSNKYRGQAIDLANQQNANAAPLRTAAQGKLLSTPPNLSSIYQNSQNVFSPSYRSLS